ncbi:hypothetical protein CDAR_44011 [Caerostris darwini]|uniref:Uncharacterized protein n=1 Tax=Caerostris darwini TaxID=1538125 RepID=A0AAV4RQL3_9ARAC|nr:hypothetical protein CDAR_44011 [Caerostris darwini]
MGSDIGRYYSLPHKRRRHGSLEKESIPAAGIMKCVTTEEEYVSKGLNLERIGHDVSPPSPSHPPTQGRDKGYRRLYGLGCVVLFQPPALSSAQTER